MRVRGEADSINDTSPLHEKCRWGLTRAFRLSNQGRKTQNVRQRSVVGASEFPLEVRIAKSQAKDPRRATCRLRVRKTQSEDR